MRVALVNPNTNAETTAMMRLIAAEAAPSAWAIEGVTAPQGAPLIATPDQLAEAGDAVANLAPQLAGYDGVIVAAFGDPGVRALRAALDAPVVGIAEAAMATAARHGRFAVVTTTQQLTHSIVSLAQAYGHGPRFTSVHLTSGEVFALMRDHALLVEHLRTAIHVAVDRDGADAVIIGGGPLSKAARALSDETPVPLVEPVPAAVDVLNARFAHTDVPATPSRGAA